MQRVHAQLLGQLLNGRVVLHQRLQAPQVGKIFIRFSAMERTGMA